MKSVAELARDIVAREGGYVDDPDDPGGATKHGVTIGTLRRLGIDKTGDGKITRADVRQLSRKDAEEIFLRHYFEDTGVVDLPEILQPPVFDMVVNAGKNAVFLLQRLLEKMGFDLVVDGVMGPLTAGAAHQAAIAAPDHLADAYGIERRNYYYRLADRRAASRKYARARDGGKGGWIKRAEAFMSPKYHLSLAAHRERTKSWDL